MSTTISLDHYVGRSIDKVKRSEDGYVMTLAGGIEVAVHDKRMRVPEELVEEQLQVVILSGATQKTRLRFSSGRELEFAASAYSILDPNRDMKEPVFPQRNTDVSDIMTPPHPDDRVTEDETHPLEDETEDES